MSAWRAWLVVARTIGRVNARIVLTVMYVAVVGPFGLAARWFSDPLALRRPAAWTPPSPAEEAPGLARARQQF